MTGVAAAFSLVTDEPIRKGTQMTLDEYQEAIHGFDMMAHSRVAKRSVEDATEAVIANTNYIFTNTALQNAPGLNFIVTADRGTGTADGYISSIKGAFR